jgi:Fe-S cluster assembly protein SufD
MRDARLAAWELYRRMPMPHHREEPWRRFPVRRIPAPEKTNFLAAERYEPVSGLAGVPSVYRAGLADESQVSGTLVHHNGSPIYGTLDDALKERGVVFGDLSAAVREYPELVRRYFMVDGVPPNANKFAALHAAVWNGGTFLYVPKGVEVELPLQSLIGITEEGLGSFHHTLIVAEEGSSVVLVEDRVSTTSEASLNSEVVEVFVGPAARVRYVNLQQWDEHRWNFTTQHTFVERDGDFKWVVGSVGSGWTKDFIRTDLVGPGANSEVYGFMFLQGDQTVDQSTFQRHVAGNTYSNLLFRNVIRDSARSVFYGMIRVEPDAQGTDAYQSNNNLMLSDTARADTIPGLEIVANDVRCSHGATVGQMDPEQVFYLQARGLPRREAERLIVHGFFEPVTSRIPLEEIREKMSDLLDERFGR